MQATLGWLARPDDHQPTQWPRAAGKIQHGGIPLACMIVSGERLRISGPEEGLRDGGSGPGDDNAHSILNSAVKIQNIASAQSHLQFRPQRTCRIALSEAVKVCQPPNSRVALGMLATIRQSQPE